MEKPSLDDWVWVLAMLNQAMLGVISTNIRQICLSYENGWKIVAIVEHPNEEDNEDIEDIAVETGIFMEDIKDRLSSCAYARVTAEINVEKATLKNPTSSACRIVYRRKEQLGSRLID